MNDTVVYCQYWRDNSRSIPIKSLLKALKVKITHNDNDINANNNILNKYFALAFSAPMTKTY